MRFKRRKRIKPFKSWSTRERGFLLLVIGLLILIAQLTIGYFWDACDSDCVRYFVLSILSAIASIFIVSAVWEWFCKIAFAKQIQLNFNIAEKVIDSGIKNVITFREIDWKAELKKISDFTVCVRFGNEWRNYHQDLISNLLRAGGVMTVVLPDYDNNSVINSLLLIYPQNHGESNTASAIKKQIEDSAKGYKELGAQVMLYPGVFNNSFYRLDNTIFYSPYTHDVSETQLPVLKISEGTLFDFCADDIEDIIKNSRLST